MAGYIDGKVEIFCGNNPPYNLNLLWYRRFLRGGKDYYALYEFDIHTRTWVPLNSALITGLIMSEDNDFIIGEDGFMICEE